MDTKTVYKIQKIGLILKQQTKISGGIAPK